MINNKVSLKDKLQLIYKFFCEPGVWGDLIKDNRPAPPTPEAIDNRIRKSTFPALEILEVEDWWMKARLYFYVTGDSRMLKMEGDPDPEEEKQKTVRMWKEQLEFDKAWEEGNEEVIQAYETKHKVRFVRFPKEIKKEYIGMFISWENDIFKLQDKDGNEISFNPGIRKNIDFIVSGKDHKRYNGSNRLEGFDLEKPIKATTIAFAKYGTNEIDPKYPPKLSTIEQFN
jgi:hypothetical protein